MLDVENLDGRPVRLHKDVLILSTTWKTCNTPNTILQRQVFITPVHFCNFFIISIQPCPQSFRWSRLSPIPQSISSYFNMTGTDRHWLDVMFMPQNQSRDTATTPMNISDDEAGSDVERLPALRDWNDSFLPILPSPSDVDEYDFQEIESVHSSASSLRSVDLDNRPVNRGNRIEWMPSKLSQNSPLMHERQLSIQAGPSNTT
jgi:hypothetical protein